MRKIFLIIPIAIMMIATACDRAEVDLPEPRAESPSPTPTPTFELEGTVVEASGSADAQADDASPGATASPRGTASPTGSPSPTDTASPGATDLESPAAGGIAIEQAAPGSIALELTSYTSPDGECDFGVGDTVVVSYTRKTTFDPAETTGDEDFPNNLARSKVNVKGEFLLPAENCLLSANSVSVLEQPSPSPTARGRGRASPTPAARRSPASSPATSPTATATPTASPTRTTTP